MDQDPVGFGGLNDERHFALKAAGIVVASDADQRRRSIAVTRVPLNCLRQSR